MKRKKITALKLVYIFSSITKACQFYIAKHIMYNLELKKIKYTTIMTDFGCG